MKQFRLKFPLIAVVLNPFKYGFSLKKNTYRSKWKLLSKNIQSCYLAGNQININTAHAQRPCRFQAANQCPPYILAALRSRKLPLSATIQGIFLLIAWYAVQTRQHSERNTANEPIAILGTAVQSASVANEVTPTISPDNPAGQATSSEQEAAPKQIAPNSTAPRSTAQHTLPSDNSGAQVVRPREKLPSRPPASSTASAPPSRSTPR